MTSHPTDGQSNSGRANSGRPNDSASKRTATPPGDNAFLAGSLPALFARTAIPIIFLMAMNGLMTVIDAYFLGVYVGADALAAVTLMFPAFMLLVAMSTLVASGMASVLARQLGSGDMAAAGRTFVSAQALALTVCAVLIIGFAGFGGALIDRLANGSVPLATMGYTYISILIWFSPINFLLSVNSDALRCEGRVAFMALGGLGVSLANIAFNYLLIVVLDYGVAGSAFGTVLAQAAALAIISGYRAIGRGRIKFARLTLSGWNAGWRQFLALGAPQSLSFVGISLGSTAIIAALQIWNPPDYSATVAAYGIILRILTFTFLPLMGLSMAMQTVIGNNFGAQLWKRSDDGLRLAIGVSFVYCAAIQLTLFTTRKEAGHIFVDDMATTMEVTRILPITTAMYFLTGPMMMLAGYFQAVGDAGRAAVLGLSRTYVFTLPMIFILPFAFGEPGVWFAGPSSEAAMAGLTMLVLVQAWRATGWRWGIFRDAKAAMAPAQ